MKITIKKATLLAAVGMLSITGTNAQTKNTANGMTIYSGRDANIENETKEEKKDLTLFISVVENNSKVSNATVKIYHENLLIAVLNSNMQRNMKVELKNNSYYVAEISSPGYARKSIMISTLFPDDTLNNENNTAYEHKTSISLTKQPVNSTSTYSAPSLSGVVYYNSEQDNFVSSTRMNDLTDKKDVLAQLQNWQNSLTIDQR